MTRIVLRQIVLLEDQLLKGIGSPSPSDLRERLVYIEALIDVAMRESDVATAVWNPHLPKLRAIDVSRPRAAGQALRAIRKAVVDKNAKTKTKSRDTLNRIIARKTPHPLLAVLNPVTNFREIYKNALLLDDHLRDKTKRCLDCICKHGLLLEAYIEEASTLDVDQRYTSLIQSLRNHVQRMLETVRSRSGYPTAMRHVQSIRDKTFPYVRVETRKK